MVNTVSIIGLGLIGGSLAKLIRRQLPETHILALDQNHILENALAEKVIDGPLQNLEDGKLFSSDLIILGTHLDTSETLLKTLAESNKNIAVMDLGSVKTPICQLADLLPHSLTFIGGHPMAGREVSGFENSHWNIFLSKRFLLTPCKKTSPEFQQTISLWLQELGMVPMIVDYQHHDQLMAFVSHFPQFYAIALANLLAKNNPDELLQFSGGGIDDQMRLMASPYDMWQLVFSKNKNNLETVLDQFIEILSKMKQQLSKDHLKPSFDQSHKIYAHYQQARLKKK